MERPPADLRAVAAEAVEASGDFLRATFRAGAVDATFTDTDVKAAADRESERLIRAVVAARFPGHTFHGEEVGRVVADPTFDGARTADNGTDVDVDPAIDAGADVDVRTDADAGRATDGTAAGDYRWVVDPLDGTNNVASGYPLCATAVAVLRAGEPVVAAIYEPLTDDLYLAERGAGATLNGEPLSVTGDAPPSSSSLAADAPSMSTGDAPPPTSTGESSTAAAERPTTTHSLPLDRGTVALVVGLSAVESPPLAAAADALRGALEAECKRVVESWAPCVDWGLLARGSIEGLVCFHPDRYEQHAGALLAAESGVTAADTLDADDGRYVAAPDPETAETLSAIVDRSLDG